MRSILIFFANFFSILQIICIGIIKLIINLIYNIAASVQDCASRPKVFDAQFAELKNVNIKAHTNWKKYE